MRRTLQPIGSGVVAPLWAMPAELVRQASRRLRIAALGVGLAFATTIVLINLVEVTGWYSFSHLAVRNVVCAVMIGISAAMLWIVHSGRFAPARLFAVALAFEILVAFAISIGDHLQPLSTELPLLAISWLCVWIVMFPLVVPASPRWALVAGVAAASTWPLAYRIGLTLGNRAAPVPVVLMNALENYIAAALAMFATVIIQRLQELGCYHLEEKLDHGGMGEIWRARHRMLARPVAVKLIRPELLGLKTPAEAAALVGRFQREAEATAALQSPHSVALHDFGVTPDGVFYYVMDLLEGLDLESLVKRFGAVPPARAVHLLIQACDSLAEAHSVGLIHRDVKPANIIACRWGLKWDFVKVLDFGLVKRTWRMGEDDHLTTEGVITGTPAFMAPEAALGGRSLDARVDLYGLGCVAYWLLTGERVFAGRTPVEVLFHHVKTPPVPPSKRSDQPIPAQLEELVLACLAKEPEERPASAEWLSGRLSECEIGSPWTAERAREWWESNASAAFGARRETAGAARP
ncbi:MAG TPA: serine/threonine-protein kinase [Vicinamibacteria bacterium]|nr:serine/threonine-protein kinase [Vicinamibacteria bacterium]